MGIQKSVTFILCIVFYFMTITTTIGQIWPGDVNNNGIVNGVDLLYWGIAFGSEGPERADQETDWEETTAPDPWNIGFPNGIDYSYADCNGDGEVDFEDFEEAIQENLFETQGPLLPDGYANGSVGTAPGIKLTPDATIVGEGAIIEVGISFENTNLSSNDFYGFAIAFSYTSELLAADSGLDFQISNDNWMAADASLVVDLFPDSEEDEMPDGESILAITRTNQSPIPFSEAEFGKFQIVIEDIIVGLSMDTFKLQIDSVLMISASLNPIPTVPDTATIIISDDPPVVSSTEPQALKTFNVFPNPTREGIYVESNFAFTQLYLTDVLGKVHELLVPNTPFNRHYIPLSFPPGVYWLTVKSATGVLTRQLIISHSEK